MIFSQVNVVMISSNKRNSLTLTDKLTRFGFKIKHLLRQQYRLNPMFKSLINGFHCFHQLGFLITNSWIRPVDACTVANSLYQSHVLGTIRLPLKQARCGSNVSLSKASYSHARRRLMLRLKIIWEMLPISRLSLFAQCFYFSHVALRWNHDFSLIGASLIFLAHQLRENCWLYACSVICYSNWKNKWSKTFFTSALFSIFLWFCL